jgi:hypothetical protein
VSKCVSENLLCDFSLSGMCCCRITGETPNARKSKSPLDFNSRYTTSDLILHAKDLVLAEYMGVFSLAKVNFFAVFHLCFKILRDIARRVNTQGSDAYLEHMEEHMDPRVAKLLDPRVEHVEMGIRCVAQHMMEM